MRERERERRSFSERGPRSGVTVYYDCNRKTPRPCENHVAGRAPEKRHRRFLHVTKRRCKSRGSMFMWPFDWSHDQCKLGKGQFHVNGMVHVILSRGSLLSCDN